MTTKRSGSKPISVAIGILIGILLTVCSIYIGDILRDIFTFDLPGSIYFDVPRNKMHIKMVEDNNSILVLERGTEEIIINMADYSIDSHLIASKNGSRMYFTAQKKNCGKKSLMEINLPESNESLKNYKIEEKIDNTEIGKRLRTKAAWPVKAIDISEDGSRILIDIAIMKRSSSRGNERVVTRPYVFDLEKDELKIVTP